ncbi:MAG: hypothetical protein K8R63_01590 [Bacteroidales bacterium]|nr:hypothetical protein [Bacteroidales bacterium]
MHNKYQNKYRIDSNRFQFWNYSAPGKYFITICIAGREEILGSIKHKKNELSDFGEIVKSEFLNIPNYHIRAFLDEWVIMPNHVHCIITLDDYQDDDDGTIGVVVEKIHEFSLQSPPSFQLPSQQPFQSPPRLSNHIPSESEIKQYRKQRRKMLIPKILGKFKMQTSKQINILRNTPGETNWQSNYHDHIIRNNDEYKRIKHYIINNPKEWDNDKFYNINN